MDLEAEMRRLSQDARRELDERRKADDAARAELGARGAGAAEEARAAGAARDADREDEEESAPASLGMRVLAGLGLLLVLLVLWSVVIAPLLKLALTLAVLAILAWGVYKVVTA